MIRKAVLLAAVVVVLSAGAAVAQEETAPAAADAMPTAAQFKAMADDLAKTRQELGVANQRIEELGARVGTIQGNVGEATKDVHTLSTQLQQIEVKSREIPEVGGVVFKPYGYIKLDMAHDSTRTTGTGATAFVIPETAGFSNDRHFTITARQTRFGVNITGPDVGEGKSAGKIEVDFYAPATIENKSQIMMRQAYWQLSYANWNILAGQSWEVVSPAFPKILNYAYLALSGNPGYRKPMVRYQRTDKAWGEAKLRTDLAVTRGIGTGAAPLFRSGTWLDDEATDSGAPDVQARVGLSIPTKVDRPVVLGISGHYGREEYDPVVAGVVVGGRGVLYNTYSANVDWAVPLCKSVDFSGEFFYGSNLDGYMGGIGQGVNVARGEAVDSAGGWGQLCYHPSAKWLFTMGAGIDDPDNGDLSTAGRSRNATYFANAIYNINKQTRVGLEVSYMETEWVGIADGDNIRVQSSLQFNF